MQVPLNPPSQRVDAMTRCQGTGSSQPVLGANGLRRIACPTALAQPEPPRLSVPARHNQFTAVSREQGLFPY